MISKVGLARLVARLERDPTIGIAGCRIINSYTRKLDQWLYQHPAATHQRTEFETYAFSAAGAAHPRDAIRAAGSFWDDLFIYNEEIDLSIRILRSGYRIIYYPGRVSSTPTRTAAAKAPPSTGTSRSATGSGSITAIMIPCLVSRKSRCISSLT